MPGPVPPVTPHASLQALRPYAHDRGGRGAVQAGFDFVLASQSIHCGFIGTDQSWFRAVQRGIGLPGGSMRDSTLDTEAPHGIPVHR